MVRTPFIDGEVPGLNPGPVILRTFSASPLSSMTWTDITPSDPPKTLPSPTTLC